MDSGNQFSVPLMAPAILTELLTQITIHLRGVILWNVLRRYVTGSGHWWVHMTWWRGYHGWKRKEARQWGMRWPVYHCVTARMKFWSLGNHHNPSNTVVLNNLYSERPCTKKERLSKKQENKYVGRDSLKGMFLHILKQNQQWQNPWVWEKENTKG